MRSWHLTGLRRGEALGLRWADVDLVSAVITVRQQLVQVGWRVEFGPPKTSSGEHRIIELDDATVGALIAQQLRQHTAWGKAYTDLGLVFAREDGSPALPDTASKTFRMLAAAARNDRDAGGPRGTRTRNLRIKSPQLCQLS